jgi:large subunit ribosomal protein L7/L12
MPIATKDEIIEAIAKMSVLELSDLVKELEEKFGVKAQAAVAPAPAPAPAKAEEAEEKTEFDVILQSVGDKKIQVLKEIRTITGLGLKESKAKAESAPTPIKEGVSKEEAEEIKKKLEGVGATVEIK